MTRIQDTTKDTKSQINLPNEPFKLIGRLEVEYVGGKWTHSEKYLPESEITEMVFPDENYVYEEMQDYIFLGAYDNSECVGVAILSPHFTGRLYLEDLKVSKKARGKGVGKILLEACLRLAKERGFKGLFTIGQDNNLIACRLYLSAGLHIGGLDTDVYKGTNQEGKADVYFYSE